MSEKPEKKKHEIRIYTRGEEIANAVSHGVGALLALVALPILIVVSLQSGNDIHLFAALIYGITMFLEYLMSTLYHALTHEKAKKVFKVLDHSFIYLFIAGTYTPFCLITLANTGGMYLCLFVWILGFIGVACEAFWVFRPRWVSVLIYLLLGWSIIVFIPNLIELLPTEGLWLLFAGGICYSLGCIFYILKKIPYMHSIFHLWILAGSICHFFAIVLYVL